MRHWNKLHRKMMGALGGATLVALGLGATTSTAVAETISIVTPSRTTALDPMRTASSGNIEVYGQLYSRLLRRNPQTLALEPGLAES